VSFERLGILSIEEKNGAIDPGIGWFRLGRGNSRVEDEKIKEHFHDRAQKSKKGGGKRMRDEKRRFPGNSGIK